MFFYTYLLQSKINNSFYIGYTNDLKKRFKEHNLGLSLYTNRYKPWELIYYEACLNREDAMRREKYLKTNQGARLMKRRIKEFLYKKRDRKEENQISTT